MQSSQASVPQRTFDGVRRWLNAVGKGPEGGIYSYQANGGKQSPAMIATGAFCAQLMGLSPNTDRAIETTRRIAALGVVADDRYDSYYAMLAAGQNQGSLWRTWGRDLREALLASQAANGTWAPGGPHANRMGTVVATAFAALSLQAH